MEHLLHIFTPAGCGEHMLWPWLVAATGPVWVALNYIKTFIGRLVR